MKENSHVSHKTVLEKWGPHINNKNKHQLSNLILTSSQTGRSLWVISDIFKTDDSTVLSGSEATVFKVGNLDEQWKVTIKMEEL